MAEGKVPVKPGVFKCPEDFESREYTDNLMDISENEDDYELVLIGAPNDLEFALLDSQDLPINGIQYLRLNKENETESLRIESQQTEKDSNLTLLLPQNGKIVPATMKFTSHISITKDIEVPQITFPPSSPKVQELPEGLKQRYTAFGADKPIVTVGENDILKRKKKSTKVKVTEKTQRKPSSKTKNASLSKEEADVENTSQNISGKTKKAKTSSEDEEILHPSIEKIPNSLYRRIKKAKTSSEDEDISPYIVKTPKKGLRQIKKATTSSEDEDIPPPIVKTPKKGSRQIKKKEKNSKEISTSSDSDSTKPSVKEKMKLTHQYVNQLDTEQVSISANKSHKKKKNQIFLVESEVIHSPALEKKTRKPKKNSNDEFKPENKEKTPKRVKGNDDHKSKEELINKIMEINNSKRKGRKSRANENPSFSQEF